MACHAYRRCCVGVALYFMLEFRDRKRTDSVLLARIWDAEQLEEKGMYTDALRIDEELLKEVSNKKHPTCMDGSNLMKDHASPNLVRKATKRKT